MRWESYAKRQLPNSAECVDLFVARVREAIRQYGLDQAAVKIYRPREAKKKLARLTPIIHKASDALNEVNAGTILLVSELASQYNETSTPEEMENFDNLKNLLNTCRRNLVIAFAALSQKGALSGENNPLTQPKIKLQKQIFLCYMEAARLDTPPKYSDKDFRSTFELILHENNIPITNQHQNFNIIRGFLTAQ